MRGLLYLDHIEFNACSGYLLLRLAQSLSSVVTGGLPVECASTGMIVQTWMRRHYVVSGEIER